MCGLSFIYSFKDNLPCSLIQQMNDKIVHRGPDGEGIHFIDLTKDNKFKIGFGHRRLKIIDLSAASNQPMISECGNYIIIFNGEIYNFKKLKVELGEKGHSFNSQGDTEVLLNAYKEWGKACLAKIKGMFSFIIYNIQTKKVFIARDRFGIKPLYYWFSPKGFFAVASEIKQFIELPGWEAKANIERIEDFLSQGLQDHTHETFFQDIYQVHPGHFYEGNLEPHYHLLTIPYYSLDTNEDIKGYPDQEKRFKDLFFKALGEHLEADVEIGAGVSGGLDSSSIVYGLKHINPSFHLKTFSTYSENKDFDERSYIQKVSQDISDDAHLIHPQGVDFFELLNKITWHHDEPVGTPSIFSEWFVYAYVSQTNVKVTLEGHGADELLCGYLEFVPFYLKHLFQKKKYCTLLKEFFYISLNYLWITPRLLRKKINLRQLQWPIQFFNKVDALTENLNYSPLPSADAQNWRLSQVRHTSLPKQLHWADRDAMAHSIELRVPFLDHELVDFLMSSPIHFMFRHGWSKSLMRKALKKIVPKEILKRRSKIGFPSLCEIDFLKEKEVAYFIEKNLGKLPFKAEVFKNFQIAKNHHSHDIVCWRIFALAIWMEQFKVNFTS